MFTDFADRPNKAFVRKVLVDKSPILRTALLLPSTQCLDLKLLKDRGKITKDTRLIVAENGSPEAFAEMLKTIESLGLTGNVAKSHFGNITDLTREDLGDDLDLVNLDLCGCLGLNTLKWVYDVVRPILKGLFSVTYAQSFRKYQEVPIMLNWLQKDQEPKDGICSYERFRSKVENQYRDYIEMDKNEDNLQKIQLYITQYNYILQSIFQEHNPSLHYKTYNDSQTHMCVWYVNCNDKYIWKEYDESLNIAMLKFMNFKDFYDRVSKLIPEPPADSIENLLAELSCMKARHHAEEMRLLQKIQGIVTP
jgi:hypothetical protein